mgnify:CR=1 FL=1
MSDIAPALIDAYRQADYWVGGNSAAETGIGGNSAAEFGVGETTAAPGEANDTANLFRLNIDAPSGPLARLYRDRGVSSAAYITAFNPYSRGQSPAGNEAAHHALVRAVQERRLALLHAESRAPDGSHPEKGLLALGIDLVEIGRAHV